MKNLLRALPLAAVFFVFGCHKDPTPAPTVSDKISGVWLEKETWTDDDLDGTFVLHNEPCDGDTEWTFNADGKLHYKDNTPCDLLFPIDLGGTWQLIADDHIQIKLEGLEDEPIDLMINAISETEITLHTIWPNDPAAATEDKLVLRR